MSKQAALFADSLAITGSYEWRANQTGVYSEGLSGGWEGSDTDCGLERLDVSFDKEIISHRVFISWFN